MWLASWYLNALLRNRSAEEVTRGFWFVVGWLTIVLVIVPALLYVVRGVPGH